LFRGYVCANCGAIVSVDATSCDECGAVFEQPESKGPSVGSLSLRRQPAPAPAPEATAATQSSRFCPYCGARSWPGDAFCWNCGARFTGNPKVVTASASGGTVPIPSTAETVPLPPTQGR